MRLFVCLVAAACMVLLPLAEAQSSQTTIDFRLASFSAGTIDLTSTISGLEAAQIRGMMDLNGDGQVSQAEVNEAAEGFKDFMAGASAQELKGNTTLDGRQPTAVSVNTLELTGAVGSASSTAGLTATVELSLTFIPDSGDTHTLVLIGAAAEGDETAQITIYAPSGSIITSTSGLPGPSVSTDKTSVTYTDSAGNDQTGTIVFGKAAAPASSAPGAGLAAIVACLALAAMRRIRA